jgi:adenosylhomocysteinase
MILKNGCEILDINLAPSGRDKIAWVRNSMPVMKALEKRFIEEKPLAGKTVTISIHLEAKTAYFAMLLRSAGAKVYVTGCNPLSTQDDVAAALAAEGFTVNAIHGVSAEDYTRHLVQSLSCKPDIIVDDGGDLVSLLHDTCPEYAENLIAGCEETTTGVIRMKARSNAGRLNFPMIAVNDAKSKHLFDNRYGTGQSTWDAIMHTTNLMVTGKTVVVAGYGFCGKGIAKNAKGLGAQVIVTEVDPHAALEALMDGHRVMPMDEAVPFGDLFVTATGCRSVITEKHFPYFKDGAILCNAGHFDVEVDVAALAEVAVKTFPAKPNIDGYTLPCGKTVFVLGQGRLVNLAAGNGHPTEIMDMSFGLQALCVEYAAKHGHTLEKGRVYNVPEELDRQVALLKLAGMGLSVDKLTPEQEAYLAGWEV